jgi:hypothetical protein
MKFRYTAVSRGAYAMKQALAARVAAAAGRAARRLGSSRRQLSAYSMAGCAAPWAGGAAAKERRQEGQRRVLERRQIVTREPTSSWCNLAIVRVGPSHHGGRIARRRHMAACAAQRPRLVSWPKLAYPTKRSKTVPALPSPA